MRFTALTRPSSTLPRRAEQEVLHWIASLTLFMFCGVRAVRVGPGGFAFTTEPFILIELTHFKILFRLRTSP